MCVCVCVCVCVRERDYVTCTSAVHTNRGGGDGGNKGPHKHSVSRPLLQGPIPVLVWEIIGGPGSVLISEDKPSGGQCVVHSS